MSVPITHAKTVTIPDPTQADLDAQIALGNYPPGTVLADIALTSDYNDDHVISTAGASEGYVLKVVGGEAEWAAEGTGSAFYLNTSFTSQTSVTVTHNFGKYPLVNVFDNTGAVIIPLTVTHTSVNAFTVTFTSSTTGNIIANAGGTTNALYLATPFTSQTSVNVTHSFGAYPLVNVIDGSGEKIIPLTVTHASVNAFTVTFSASTTGTILANAGAAASTLYDATAFTSQTSVTVSHSFGVYPLVNVIDGSGAKIIPLTITHADVDNFTVTFSASTTGTILANAEGSGSTAVTPSGSNGQFQINLAGSFGGTAAATYASSGTHVTITAQSTTDTPLALKGASGHVDPLQEYLDHTGAQLSAVTAAGAFGKTGAFDVILQVGTSKFSTSLAGFSGQRHCTFGYFGGNTTSIGYSTCSSGLYSFSNSGTDSDATRDLALGRNAAGVLEVNNGTAGTFRDIKFRNATASGVVNMASYTVATLPAGTNNDRAFVTDALAPTFGAAVVGGGAVRIPVYYDGAWKVG